MFCLREPLTNIIIRLSKQRRVTTVRVVTAGLFVSAFDVESVVADSLAQLVRPKVQYTLCREASFDFSTRLAARQPVVRRALPMAENAMRVAVTEVQ